MGRTTLAVRLKPETNRDGEHVVRIRITKDRAVAYWTLNLTLSKKQFNDAATKQLENWVRRSCTDYKAYNSRILTAYRQAEASVEFFEKRDRPFTAASVRDYLEQGGLPDRLLPYFARHIRDRAAAAGADLGQLQTVEHYKATLKVLRWYLREVNKIRDEVTDETLDARFWTLSKFAKQDVLDLRAWLSANYADNTVATHLTNLRHVLYQAAEAGLVSYEKFPMRGISISFKRKKVNRLQDEDIEQLATGEARKKNRGGRFVTNPLHARPLVMLMYLAHGARLGDAVTWRMRDYVVEGTEHRLRYKTGKNDKYLSVLLDEEAIRLLAPYRCRDDGSEKAATDFLFPYLPANFDKLTPEDKHLTLRKAKGRARHQITTLGTRVGLSKHLTPHVMRHSFADMMRRSGVALETRQETLGHSDIKTTRNYEEQFDQQAVDDVSLLYQLRKKKREENSSKTDVA